MQTERKPGVELFRAGAVLLVVAYHAWVVMGGKSLYIPGLTGFVAMGGTIGVNAFFILSGYGIFNSLERRPVNDKKTYLLYMKRRFKRIAPQYYLSLLVSLFLIDAIYLSKEGLLTILAHTFFIHNLYIQGHGSISGVLWTMGVTVQFYLIAPLLYKWMRRDKRSLITVCAAGVIIAIGFRALLYAWFPLDPAQIPSDTWGYGFLGRQLITSLDSFIAGMLIAYGERENFFSKVKNGFFNKSPILLIVLAGGGTILFWCRIGHQYGVYANNLCGIIWISVLTAILAFVLLLCGMLQINSQNKIVKMGLFLSKYEYGIYVWHLFVINNMVARSPFIARLSGSRFYILGYIVLSVLSVGFGIMMEKLLNLNFEKLRSS